MAVHLTKKQRIVFSVFLKNENRVLSFNEIFSELTKQNIRISKRTVKNTLHEYDQFHTRENSPLIMKNLNETGGGVCYSINEKIETFIELARNLLSAKEFASIFFKAKFSQQFLNDLDIMKHVEKNLNVEFDEDTRYKIYQIIHNSPSALYFGLFAKNLKSQLMKNIQVLPEEAEHEIRENFISRLLDDLRDKDFFLSRDLEKLEIRIDTVWNFKRKKNIRVDLNLIYKQ